MLKWCRVKKRHGNAVLNGADLGTESPVVKVEVIRDEDLRLSKPVFKRKLLSAKERK